MKSFIIGISGGSGSGKTTLVHRLQQDFPEKTEVLYLDDYYKSLASLPMEERARVNFDHPDAFEWPLLEQHIRQLRDGKAIEQPTYDYISCTRQEATIHIEPREVIIIEGILALCDPSLRAQMDLRIFVDADADDRLIRVIKRDIVERGRTADVVIERYQRVLKPMHEQFIEPCKRYADVIVPQGGHNTAAINMLAKFIRHQIISNS